jgi:hypothetical protein
VEERDDLASYLLDGLPDAEREHLLQVMETARGYSLSEQTRLLPGQRDCVIDLEERAKGLTSVGRQSRTQSRWLPASGS